MIWMIICFYCLGYINAQPTTSDNCQQYSTNSSICERCANGYFLQYFFCVPCNRLCTCSSDDDFCQECLSFTEGVVSIHPYLSDNVCYLCNTTIPDCIACDNAQSCTQCSHGKYLKGAKCSNQTCALYCSVCQDDHRCALCEEGHYLESSGRCTQAPCTDNCLQCRTIITCLRCTEGFFANGDGLCSPCMENCSICEDDLSCDRCYAGYNYINQTCMENANGLSNCVKFTEDDSVCLLCQDGYYNSGGSCSSCSGCYLCTAPFICQSDCFVGYQRFNFACLPNYNTYFLGSFLIMVIYSLL